MVKHASAPAAASNEVLAEAQYSACCVPSAELAVRKMPVPLGHMGVQLVGLVILTMKSRGQGLRLGLATHTSVLLCQNRPKGHTGAAEGVHTPLAYVPPASRRVARGVMRSVCAAQPAACVPRAPLPQDAQQPTPPAHVEGALALPLGRQHRPGCSALQRTAGPALICRRAASSCQPQAPRCRGALFPARWRAGGSRGEVAG
jgi:hypothetical protein